MKRSEIFALSSIVIFLLLATLWIFYQWYTGNEVIEITNWIEHRSIKTFPLMCILLVNDIIVGILIVRSFANPK